MIEYGICTIHKLVIPNPLIYHAAFLDSAQSLVVNNSQSIILGDVNGDGDPDMVVGNGGGEANRAYINDISDDDSSGIFTDSQYTQFTSTWGGTVVET